MILDTISALFALIAGVLWGFASHQKVYFDPEERDEEGMYPMALTETDQSGKTFDVLKTAARQTYWNQRASLAACLAALAEALSAAAKAFGW